MSNAKRYSPDDSEVSDFKIGLKGILLFIVLKLSNFIILRNLL